MKALSFGVLAPTLAALLLAPAACARRESPAVVLITLDTLRADRLGCYGNADRLSPRLDRLAAEGALFEHVSAPVPVTLPSHASLLTGRYPAATGVRNNGSFVLPQAETTLAEVLRASGWATGAVVAAFPLYSRFGLAQGFDTYDEESPAPPARAAKRLPVFFAERDAAAVTTRALEVWRRLGRGPRFLWVHYFDPHAPYAPPEPFAARYRGRPYDGEVAYVDQEVGRLLDSILADAPRSIVAVVADHGESLGEHGEKTHGVFVYESTIRVPFLLLAPGRVPAGKRIADPASLVDVMPTILGLLGIPSPAGIQGRDLGPLLRSGALPEAPVFAESYLPRLQFRFSELNAIRRGHVKYIEAPGPEVYDLASDPGETRNLHGSHPEETRLASELAQALRAADPDASGKAQGALDPATEAALRSLGYVSAGSLGAAPGEGRGRDPKTMTDYLRRYDHAVGLLSEGRFDEGTAELRRLVPEAPENFMARYQLGAGLYTAGRLPEAESELLRVVEAAPSFSNGHLLLAEIQGALGKIDAAIQSYDAASRTAPSLAEPWLARGSFLESSGRFEAAADAFLRAADLDPSDAESPRRLLGLRAGRGDLSRGVQELEGLAARHPRSAAIRTVLGAALRRTGDRRVAAAALEEALRLDPNRPDALVEIGELELESGHLDRAVSSFRAAAEKLPQLADARFGLARALLAAGRTAEADAEFAVLLRMNPAFSAAHTVRGRYFERRGDPLAAAEAYRRALAANPADREAWEGLKRLRGGAEPGHSPVSAGGRP